MLNIIILFIHANAYAKWYVEAKCSVPLPRENGREGSMYVFGRGSGKTYRDACNAAKDDVDIRKLEGAGQKKTLPLF